MKRSIRVKVKEVRADVIYYYSVVIALARKEGT